MHESQIESITFRAILGVSFKVGVEKKVRVLGEVIYGTWTDCEDTLVIVDIRSIYLCVTYLFEKVSIQTNTQLLWFNLVSKCKVCVDCLSRLEFEVNWRGRASWGSPEAVIFAIPKVVQPPGNSRPWTQKNCRGPVRVE